MESSFAIQRRLVKAQNDFKSLDKELEVNRRHLGLELAKVEPIRFRVKGYENKIVELEEKKKRIPFQIDALGKKLKEAEQIEAAMVRTAGMAAPLIPKLQKLSKHLALLMKEANDINNQVLRINGEIGEIERMGRITIVRPCSSTGYQSIKAICESIDSEVKGEGRRLFFWPGMDFPA